MGEITTFSVRFAKIIGTSLSIWHLAQCSSSFLKGQRDEWIQHFEYTCYSERVESEM